VPPERVVGRERRLARNLIGPYVTRDVSSFHRIISIAETQNENDQSQDAVRAYDRD